MVTYQPLDDEWRHTCQQLVIGYLDTAIVMWLMQRRDNATERKHNAHTVTYTTQEPLLLEQDIFDGILYELCQFSDNRGEAGL
jgi:hypothetical protein